MGGRGSTSGKAGKGSGTSKAGKVSANLGRTQQEISEEIERVQNNLSNWEYVLKNNPNSESAKIRVETYKERLEELKNQKPKEIKKDTVPKTKSQKTIDKANATITSKGKSWSNASWQAKAAINRNLTLNKFMKEDIEKTGTTKVSDTWTITDKKTKNKRKVITTFENGKIVYQVKNGRKTTLKTSDKNKVANHIAAFYNAIEKRENKLRR